MTGAPTPGQHDRRCGARTRSGGQCTLPAGWGTAHIGYGPCRKHGGDLPNHMKHARKVQAEEEAARWGLPVRTTAAAALGDELNRSYGRVLWLAAKVSSLDEEALLTSPWPALERWERRHLADLARGMVALDLDGRQVSLLEMFGQRLSDGLDRALAGAGIPVGQRAHVLELLPGALERGGG
jgi:hypothetical protein